MPRIDTHFDNDPSDVSEYIMKAPPGSWKVDVNFVLREYFSRSMASKSAPPPALVRSVSWVENDSELSVLESVPDWPPYECVLLDMYMGPSLELLE